MLEQRIVRKLIVDAICAIFTEIEIHVETSCWLARVPSYSNIADKPSRGSVRELVAKGFVDQSGEIAAAVSKLSAFMVRKMGKMADKQVPS